MPNVPPEVLVTLPHDTTAFTEGLQRDGTTLWESTGLAGESEMRELDPTTGAVAGRRRCPGACGARASRWSATDLAADLQDGVALAVGRATLTVRRQVAMTGEGWGLCSDGARLVQSDGTATLRFRDPGDVRPDLCGHRDAQRHAGAAAERAGVRRRAGVGERVADRPQIVRIDPASGRVTATVDASGLLTPAQAGGTDVLNGITWLGGDEFLITGKYWPVLLRVRLVVPSSDL